MVTLDDVFAELREIRRLVEDRGASSRGRVDLAADSRLLSAVSFRLGSSAFSAADLVTLAGHDAELRQALGGTDARALGGRLKRLRAHPVAPYALRRVKRDDRGTLWEVIVSPDMHTPPCLAPKTRTR